MEGAELFIVLIPAQSIFCQLSADAFAGFIDTLIEDNLLDSTTAVIARVYKSRPTELRWGKREERVSTDAILEMHRLKPDCEAIRGKLCEFRICGVLCIKIPPYLPLFLPTPFSEKCRRPL